MKLALVALLLMPCSGFAVGFDVPPPGPAAPPNSPASSTVAQANNAFAADLYGRLSQKDGNVFFSPYSISLALAMTYGGARGSTAAAMAKVLHFAGPPSAISQAYGKLDAQLRSEQTGGTLSVASSLWGQEDYPFLPAYVDTTRQAFAAAVESVDFKGASETARGAINQWVADATHDQIKSLIAPGGVTAQTRLVLCSAIYFKGKWDSPFQPESTHPGAFSVTPFGTVIVPMMNQRSLYRSVFLDGFGLLELPYQGDQLSMIIVLPAALDGLSALEGRLNATTLASWLASLAQAHEFDTQLSVPRFQSSQSLDLSKPLGQLGMASAFVPLQADFSGMTGKPDFFISAVVHQADIEVDEEGTVAAAATAVEEFQATAVMPPPPAVTFTVDHPFLYLIRDNASGSILFLGRMLDPR